MCNPVQDHQLVPNVHLPVVGKGLLPGAPQRQLFLERQLADGQQRLAGPHHRLLHRRVVRRDLRLQEGLPARHRADVADVVYPQPPGAPGDLLDLLGGERAYRLAVIL